MQDRELRMTTIDTQQTGERLLAALNEEQRLAVQHGAGPILVLAGAGSGKTRVITYRIAWLIGCRGADPASIAALTFTNRAAREMKERVVRLVGPPAAQVTCGTFHSFAARELRRLAWVVGRTPGFAIYDQDDQARLIRSLLREVGIAGSAADRVPGILSWIDRLKGSGQDPASRTPPEGMGLAHALELLALYEQRLRQADAFDFGDLIAKLVEILARDESRVAELRRRFRHLLVDEYQDTSPAQDRLVGLLAGEQGDLMVVGDDDQAIYGWRGASADNILGFAARYPGCAVVRLQHNYRSCPPILEAANEVIRRSSTRLGKELMPVRQGGLPVEVLGFPDDRQEAEGVAAACREHVEEGGGYGDLAIFFRTAALARRVEEALLRAAVPYSVLSGTRFYERAEVKDLLAWARLLVNPRDGVAARRAMTVPRRGIGEATLERLAGLVAAEELTWLEGARRLAAAGKGRAAAGLQSFVTLCEELEEEVRGLPPSRALVQILERNGLARALHDQGDAEARDRLANLNELLLAAAELELREPEARLSTFLEQASLAGEADTGLSGERVALLTLHAAKGLEFDRVFIIGLEEGTFPLGREGTDLEEERRLCYVGMTRARERLTLTWAAQRRRFQETQICQPSRFLGELPRSVLATRLEREVQEEPSGRFGRRRRAGLGPREGSGRPLEAGLRAERAGSGRGEMTAAPEDVVDPFPDYENGADGWAEERADLPEPGELVFHASFGEGEVVEVNAQGLRTTVAVRFPFRGVKRVQLEFLERRQR